MSQRHDTVESATYPHGADLELIPFDPGSARNKGSFELTADLARHDGVLYGGTGAAATVVAMETATQWDAVWVITQFIAPAHVGERISFVVHTLAQGRYVAQLQLTATVDDRVIFCALGATGRARPNGLTGQFDTMPGVTPPEDSRPLSHGLARPGLDDLVHPNMELREAAFEPRRPPGRLALWARLTAGTDLTRAGIAYLADRVPMAITRGAGRMAPGFSLDNCLRFTAIPHTQWVLLDLQGQVASRGYGHGSLTAWSPDGTLVATGNQSATMARMLDAGDGELDGHRRSLTPQSLPAGGERRGALQPGPGARSPRPRR
jgi:acyl-CoA thioesterase